MPHAPASVTTNVYPPCLLALKIPKRKCNPPKPAAMAQLPHAGSSRLAAPATMKQTPITGTVETENVPPAITPTPYNSIQTAGSVAPNPPRSNGIVRRIAAATEGTKLSATFRPGPLVQG